MPKARFLPALCLTLMAAFALPQAQADEAARPAQWAQPIAAQYNLYQMSATLYRSALPDSEAQALLDKLKIGTVINFLNEPDDTWLKTPASCKCSCPIALIMWMTPMC